MAADNDIFQQAMNQGHSAAWDQHWDQAAAHYREALDAIPDHPQALINLGLALYELQDYEQSLSYYLRAAQVAADDPLPLEKAAQILERQGNLEQSSQASLRAAELYMKNRDVNKAVESWKRVTRLNPDNLQAHSRLALVYERLGEKQKAVDEFLAVASLLQAAGDTPRAAKAVQQAIQILPASNEALQAFALLREGRPLPRPTRPRGGTAPRLMAQVRQLEAPREPSVFESSPDPITQARQKALTLLADMLFESVEEEEAPANRRLGLQTFVQGTGQLRHQVDRSKIALHLAEVVDLQTQELYDPAAAELEKAIGAGLDHPAAHFDLGYLLVQCGRPKNAPAHLHKATKNSDFALGAHLLLGELLVKEGQMHTAALEYLEALKLADAQVVDPEQADDLRQLYEPLIESFRKQTDPQAQHRLCESIVSLVVRPDWKNNLQRARQQLPPSGPGSPPIPLAEILTEARSGQVIQSLTHIYELGQQGLFRSAMEEAFYALQFAPTYLPLHTYIGELLFKEGRIQPAAAKLSAVARTYSIRGESHRAIDMYRRIIEIAPMDLNARTLLINQLVASERVEDAIQEYINLADVYYSLADLEMARKTYTDGLRLAQKFMVDRSIRVKLLHSMADIDLQSLDWRQALRIFEQIRTLQPDDEKARTNLIELNFRLGQENQAMSELDNYISHLAGAGQIQKAIAFLESLVQENPGRIAVRRRLAEGYRQVGRNQEAIAEFDKVGEGLLAANDYRGAVESLEAILALNPPNREEYQAALAQIRGY